MHGLSGCQTNVLRFVKHAIATEGAPPTIREIAQAFSVTPRAAYDHVQALIRKGYLVKHGAGRHARSLRLAPEIPAAANRSLNDRGKTVRNVWVERG